MPPSTTGPSPPLPHQWEEVIGVQIAGTGKEGFTNQPDQALPFVAQLGKNLPAMWETWAQPLGWEDALEKGKATHSSILAWRISWTKSMGLQRVLHN